MAKDPLLINKIAAGVLAAGLLGMVSAELAGALYSVETPEQNAFVIAEPSDDTQVASAAADTAPTGPADILPLLASADIAAGEKIAKKCVACHSFNEGGPNKVGPNLYDIVNTQMASRDYSYSDALAALGGAWDYPALNGFLYNPSQYVAGTKMKYKGVRKDEDRAALIAYLRSLSANPVPLP